jgi:D-isomer specific 2-hydroxyacid dehydrogenase family protein
VKGVYCTPHLGASTPESETNCAVMAANELSDYLKNGNITHSVNLPDVSQPRVGGKRICIIHRNEPGAISAITGILTAANLNIENMVNKGRKNVAYTMLDVTGNVDAGLTAQLSGIDTAIRVRIL